MAQKSIKKNYVYNLYYQILTIITPLITAPYLARVLGADGIGTISYTDSVAAYFVLLATMGISTYGQREISYVQDNIEERSHVFWNTKVLEIITSGISLCAFVLFSLYQENIIIYLIFSFNILAVLMDVTWFFQGMEEFGKTVLRNIIVKLLGIIYIFLFVKTSDDIAVYAFGTCFFAFIANVSLWFYLPRYIDRIKFCDLHPFKDFKTVLSLFIPTVAIQVYTVLDKTMIGIVTKNSFENGYYEQAIKMSKMTLMFVISLGTVMIPRIGYHYEQKQYDEVKRLVYRAYRFVWFLGIPLCFGLIGVASNFVPWFFGPGYEKVIVLLKILAFLILAIGISNVTGMQYLIPTKKQNTLTLTVIIGAVVNFTLNSLLIYFYQSIGAAIASVAAEVTVTVTQIMIVRQELSPLTILKQSVNYLLAGALMSAGLWKASGYLEPSVINTLILVVMGGSIYIGTLFLIKDTFFITNIKGILRKISVKRK